MNSSDNDIRKQLLECSVLIISILVKQYKAKKIDTTDFNKHASNKISYIISNLEYIEDPSEKSKIESLLDECNEIINTV